MTAGFGGLKRPSLHRASATGRAEKEIYSGESAKKVSPWRRVQGSCCLMVAVRSEQTLPSCLELGPDVGGSEQSAVTDLHEVRRQHVQQEAPDEFDGIERAGPAMLGAKADLATVEGDETLIREADPMGVTPEVFEDLVGSAEGLLGVHDPFLAVEAVFQFGKLRPGGAATLEAQALHIGEQTEPIEDLSPKHLRHRPDREEKSAPSVDPMAIVVEAASRDDAVNVRMKAKIAGPRMQDCGHPDLGMQAAAAELEQCAGRRRE